MFAAAASDTTVVVATSNRRLMAFDAANGAALLMDRESPLKYQTRCVSCFPNGGGVALGSVEGRVAIESLGGCVVCEHQLTSTSSHTTVRQPSHLRSSAIDQPRTASKWCIQSMRWLFILGMARLPLEVR